MAGFLSVAEGEEGSACGASARCVIAAQQAECQAGGPARSCREIVRSVEAAPVAGYPQGCANPVGLAGQVPHRPSDPSRPPYFRDPAGSRIFRELHAERTPDVHVRRRHARRHRDRRASTIARQTGRRARAAAGRDDYRAQRWANHDDEHHLPYRTHRQRQQSRDDSSDADRQRQVGADYLLAVHAGAVGDGHARRGTELHHRDRDGLDERQRRGGRSVTTSNHPAGSSPATSFRRPSPAPGGQE